MSIWMNHQAMEMSVLLSEDVCAPELRNPKVGAMRRRESWLYRLFMRSR